MLPHEAGLVGIAASIVDCADGIERGAVRSKRMTGDSDDDSVALQPEKLSVVLRSRTRDQSLGGVANREAASSKEAVEREGRLHGDVSGQTGQRHQFGGQHRTMPRDGYAIHKAKPVYQHEALADGIRQAVVPLSRLKRDQPVRSDVPGSFHRFGEAQ